MPSVPTSLVFPNARIDNQGLFIPSADLPGVSIADAAALKFAIDKLYHDAVNKLPAEQQPVNFSNTQLITADGRNASYTSNYTLTPVVVSGTLASEPPAPPPAQAALGTPVAK